MAGILVQLAISWLILWLFEKKDLRALGIVPGKKRLVDLVAGVSIAIICCFIFTGIKTVMDGSHWTLNKKFSWGHLSWGSGWIFRSVIFEELIFRGALLYIAIKRAGITKGCILSAVCFGVYHWFSYNAWGNPVQMIFIFLMTAIWGYMFAMAFARTMSLYLPAAIHFGWNFAFTLIFSNGPLGKQLLVRSGGIYLTDGALVVELIFHLFLVPAVIFIYLYYRHPKIVQGFNSGSSVLV